MNAFGRFMTKLFSYVDVGDDADDNDNEENKISEYSPISDYPNILGLIEKKESFLDKYLREEREKKIKEQENKRLLESLMGYFNKDKEKESYASPLLLKHRLYTNEDKMLQDKMKFSQISMNYYKTINSERNALNPPLNPGYNALPKIDFMRGESTRGWSAESYINDPFMKW